MSARPDWLAELIESAPLRALVDAARNSSHVVVEQCRGSSATFCVGALAAHVTGPWLYVVAHLDEADDALDDLDQFTGSDGLPLNVMRFPALEVLPGESNVALDLLDERLKVVQAVLEGQMPDVIVAPIQALMQMIPEPEAIQNFSMNLKVGDPISRSELIAFLDHAGYQRTDAIEHVGDFAVRGGLVDVFSSSGDGPIRIDFFGDEVDTIHSIDLDTLASKENRKEVRLISANADHMQTDDRKTSLLVLLPETTRVALHERLELSEQARGYFERLTNPRGMISPTTLFQRLRDLPYVELNLYSSRGHDPNAIHLPTQSLPSFAQDGRDALAQLLAMANEGERVHVICRKPAEEQRLVELLEELQPDSTKLVQVSQGYVHRGFHWDATNLVLLPHHELFHRYEVRRRIRRVTLDTSGRPEDAFLDLEVGDYVVHVDHGIARFTGVQTMRRSGLSQEYLKLEFAERAVLHVPATQIELVQKYIGGFQGKPPLSTLGGKRWNRTKESVAEAVKEMAKRLLQIQAARETTPGIRYPGDTLWQREFEAEFPYDETEDQLTAIAAIKQDMAGDRPMDRLLCGDVGFGKTEVAMRAAFKAAEYGKQVALLVPTTVLAEQHERTFKSRMADYPFRVASISRFKTSREAKDLLKELEQGQIDIMIGTHRILSKDVKFADLGLVLIDEEQRFGVEHKNKLLELRLTADVMTMTATPIPRTLHMSMVGLRDISSLSTPPVDRRAVVTEVIPFDKSRIQQALIRELNREGQVFFVHNRVHNIHSMAAEIKALVPDARIIVGHGQMSPRELEKVMLKFVRHEADILVSTTIIESGIDIPTANTMFINQADHFGLAELHQLRGRVGRYKNRAYCYLLLPQDRPINETAARRLKAIEQYSMLGAGFKIAMRDLEIRGAGNLLGAEQSGHIAAVGYEMYCVLLEQETKRLRHEPVIEPCKTHLELPIAGSLSKRYIKSDKHRMFAYRRLSRASTMAELDTVIESLNDAYGKPPESAQRLIELTELRIAASTLDIDKIKLEEPDLIFTVRKQQAVLKKLEAAPGRATVLDDSTVYWRPPAAYIQEMPTLMAVLRKLLVRPVRDENA